ncbi:NAD(P)H-binding protein [Actinophytocola sp.]|uniref:NAD(P)H-binding protein n=1 Tax=Actinophytocola sp. TaxID=1872138 RepID=UPI00389A9A43
MTTLVIGARGSIGRHVVDQLLAAGEQVRASARDPEAAGLPENVSVVAADLTKPDTVRAALTGVRKVFLYAPSGGMGAFVEAASDADLDRVVLLSSGSVLLPGAVGNAIAEEHRAVEHQLTESGLPWTPIRPLVLATNNLAWADSIRATGTVPLFRPNGTSAPVHERDVAAVAVAALTGSSDGYADRILTGPQLLSQREQVELIGTALGRDLTVTELSETQARARFGQFGTAPATIDAIIQFIAASDDGRSVITDTVERVLGRPALSFGEWAHEHAADF